MPQSKAGYYYDELTEWEHTLSLYDNESTELETKLSAIIHENTIPHLAENAEFFMKQVETMLSLIHIIAEEIYHQEKGLRHNEDLIEDASVTAKMIDGQDALRKRMKELEQHFIEIKYSCYDFLSGTHKR